jgi:hypothetical protein
LEKSEEDWEGDERREAKRRYTMDRRTMERRKRYLFTVVLPTVLGVLGAGVVSWGAYVTHSTYSISAKYEETFVDHIDSQVIADRQQNKHISDIVVDYNLRIGELHDDMNDGFKEIRDTQNNIYNLLLQRGIGGDNSDGTK